MRFADGFLDERCKALGIERSELVLWRDNTVASGTAFILKYRTRNALLNIDIWGGEQKIAEDIDRALQSLIEPPPVVVTGKPRDRAHVRLAKRRAPVSCRHWFGSAA